MTHRFLFHQGFVARNADGESCADCEQYKCTPCEEVYPCDDEPFGCPDCLTTDQLDCDTENPGYALFGPISVSGVSGHAHFGFSQPTCTVFGQWVDGPFSCGNSGGVPRKYFYDLSLDDPDCPNAEIVCGFDSQKLDSQEGDGPCLPQLTCSDSDCACSVDFCRADCYALEGSCCDADKVSTTEPIPSDPSFTRVTNLAVSTFTNDFYVTRKRGSNLCFAYALHCPKDYFCPSTVFNDPNYECCGQTPDSPFNNFAPMGVFFGCHNPGDDPICQTLSQISNCSQGTGQRLELNFGNKGDLQSSLYCIIAASPGTWPVASYADSSFIGCGCRGCSAEQLLENMDDRCSDSFDRNGGWSSTSYYKGTYSSETRVVRYTKIAEFHRCSAYPACSCNNQTTNPSAYSWSGSWVEFDISCPNLPTSAIVGPGLFDIPVDCDAPGWTYYNPPPNPPPPTICPDQVDNSFP